MGRRAAERGPHRLFARQAKCLAPTRSTLYHPLPFFAFWCPLKFLSERECSTGFQSTFACNQRISSCLMLTGTLLLMKQVRSQQHTWSQSYEVCGKTLKLSAGLLPTCDPFKLGMISSTMTSSSYSPLLSQQIVHLDKVLHTGRGIVRLSTGHSFNTKQEHSWCCGNMEETLRLHQGSIPLTFRKLVHIDCCSEYTIHHKQPGNTNLTIRNCGQNPHTTKEGSSS